MHVGLELHNTGSAPLSMDTNDIRLDVRTGRGAPLKALAPAAPQAHSVAAGALADVDWEFVLPQGVQPGDLDALRVHWRVNGADPELRTAHALHARDVRRSVHRRALPRVAYVYPCWPNGLYDCEYAYGLRLYDLGRRPALRPAAATRDPFVPQSAERRAPPLHRRLVAADGSAGTAPAHLPLRRRAIALATPFAAAHTLLSRF